MLPAQAQESKLQPLTAVWPHVGQESENVRPRLDFIRPESTRARPLKDALRALQPGAALGSKHVLFSFRGASSDLLRPVGELRLKLGQLISETCVNVDEFSWGFPVAITRPPAHWPCWEAGVQFPGERLLPQPTHSMPQWPGSFSANEAESIFLN